MALDESLLSRPASPSRIQQYYAGAPLDWDIIAAEGDIERDQRDNLVQLLSEPAETLRLFCIVAEPGAGKSTLARRVAAELYHQHEALVLRVKDNEDPGVWYRLPEFWERVGRPFYVLVDDLFRNPAVVNAIREIASHLPITVLATSRKNEYHPRRLRGKVESVLLTAPSPGEKEQILRRVGPLDLFPDKTSKDG